jgi:hypothetical protein
VYDDQNENRQNDNERGQLVTNIHPFVNNQTGVYVMDKKKSKDIKRHLFSRKKKINV